MEQLWITLPAIAPDYSGVCSAMFDLGGLSVIHDASGCTGNYTGYDEPRWYGTDSKVYCSGLREIDAVLGRDDKLINNIIKTVEYTNPKCISVIGSPVPMVIGSDLKGIAHEIEESTNIPSFGFNTNGIKLYNVGVSEAILTLIKRFAKAPEKKIDKSVNVIGTTPIDFSANSNASDLYKLLENNGYTIIGKLMMEADLGQIESLTEASLNLVVTESGLDAAKYLYKEYGIPYVVGTFVGKNTSRLFELIEKARLTKEKQVLLDEATCDNNSQILIVGEQVLGNSIRNHLLAINSNLSVVVGTMTGLRKEIANESDIDIASEESLISELESGKYSVLIGDPLLGDLLEDSMNIRHIEIPHVALSSKLYWSKSVHFISSEMEDILAQAI